MVPPLRLGISTCPNDTFAFHGILSGKTSTDGLQFDLSLHDVQELNEGLRAGIFDVAKGSCAVGLELAGELVMLPVGAALGFGNGPLVLAPKQPRPAGGPFVVLGPGRDTTAELLFRLFYPEQTAPRSVVFSEIMPALQAGRADLGVCIHEGRFTYEEAGLKCVEDLGLRWEALTQGPLPLGGLFAKKSLDPAITQKVVDAISESLAYARAHPDEALLSMRQYAQEQSDEVLRSHVELYVNEHTTQLGELGGQALARLEAEARAAGLLPGDGPALQVFGA